MNKQNNLCYLCSIKAEEFLDISNYNGRKLQIAEIVSKHLQFMKKVDYAAEIICKQCWSLVSDFHQFYVRIEEVHARLEMTIVKNEPVQIEGSFDTVPDDNFIQLDDWSQQSNSDNEYIKNEPEIEIIDDSFVSNLSSRKIERKNDKTTNCNKNVKQPTYQDIFNRSVKHHLTNLVKPSSLTCDYCQKEFYVKRKLHYHLLTHVDLADRQYRCDLCDRAFVKKFKLIQHQRVRHPDENEKVFGCDQCDKRFVAKYLLQSHVAQSHGVKNSFICELCTKGFSSHYNYVAHKKLVHDRILPPVQCNICALWLSNRNNLKNHMKTHTEMEVTCKFCFKILKNHKSLRKHCKEVHSDQPLFKCTICAKEYRREINLKEHMSLHTGDVLYSCSFCTKTCNSNANMYKHLKTAHPTEYQLKVRLHMEAPILPRGVKGIDDDDEEIRNLHMEAPMLPRRVKGIDDDELYL